MARRPLASSQHPTRELDLVLVASECQVCVRADVPKDKTGPKSLWGGGTNTLTGTPQILTVCFWSRYLANPCGFSWCLSASLLSGDGWREGGDSRQSGSQSEAREPYSLYRQKYSL